MYYLHVTTAGASPDPNGADARTHGPFASEKEALGFMTKLTLWYPARMQHAHFQVSDQDGVVIRRDSVHHSH